MMRTSPLPGSVVLGGWIIWSANPSISNTKAEAVRKGHAEEHLEGSRISTPAITAGTHSLAMVVTNIIY